MKINNVYRKICLMLVLIMTINSFLPVEALDKNELKIIEYNKIMNQVFKMREDLFRNQKNIAQIQETFLMEQEKSSKKQSEYSEEEQIYTLEGLELPPSFIFDENDDEYRYIPSDERNIELTEVVDDPHDNEFIKDEYYNNFIEIINNYNYFSELEESEIVFICSYALVNREAMYELDNAGKTLVESFSYANIEYKYGIKIEEILNSCSTTEQCNELYRELGIYNAILSLYNISQDNELLKYIMSGHKTNDVLIAYIINQEYDIDISILLSGDNTYITQIYSYISKTDIKDFEDFCNDYGLNKTALIECASKNEIKFKDFEEKINNYLQELLNVINQTSTEPTEIILPKKEVGAPYSFEYNQTERINLNSGGLVYEVTDSILKGRNGLDLTITRRYDSEKANVYNPEGEIRDIAIYDYYLYYTYIAYYDVPGVGEGRWSYYDDENIYTRGPFTLSYLAQKSFDSIPTKRIKNFDGEGTDLIMRPELIDILGVHVGYRPMHYSKTIQNKYLDNMYGLGTGWSFAFSSIEDEKYLHLSNGNTYAIEFTDVQGDSNLKDYNKTDIRLEKSGEYSNGSVNSQYILYHKDGRKEYFSKDGKLIGIKDKFNNEIKYVHTTVSGKPKIEITDTVGRIITIESKYIDSTKDVTVVKLPEGELKYTISKEEDIKSLTRFENQLKNTTNYSYNISSGGFDVFNKSTNSGNNRYVNLSTITHPTGYQTQYTYESYEKNLGDSGLELVYRITKRKDSVGSDSKNEKIYSYSYDNMSGYPTYLNPLELPDGFTYNTIVKTELTGITKTSIFNKKHLLLKEESKLSGKITNSTEIQYDEYKLPVKVEEKRYNTSGSFMKAVTLMENDIKGNVIASWSPLAEGNKSNIEYKTSYIYDNAYNMLLSKTYKQNSNTTIIERNTLSNANKTVGVSEVLVNGVVKEKQSFGYDSYGNPISIKRYKNDIASFEETQYNYAQGAYLSEIRITGIKNADNTLAKQTPGQSAGTIVVKYPEYDDMGRVKKAADANGYITLYQYDILGNISKQTNPDGTTIEYKRNYTSNYVDVKNENDIWTRYEYTPNGLEYATYISEDQGENYVMMNKKSYDGINRLIKESDVITGTDIVYEYNNLSDIISKRILQGTKLLSEEKYKYEDAYESGKYRKITKTIVGEGKAPSIVMTEYINNIGQTIKTGKIDNTEYIDTYIYDYLGNNISAKSAYAAERSLTYSSKWDYDHVGRVIKSYNADGDYTTDTYDRLGNKISSTDCLGNTVTYKYDGVGRLIEEVVPIEQGYNQIKRYYYDPAGNIIKTTISNHKKADAYSERKIEYEYDMRGRLEYAIVYNNTIIDSVTKYIYDGVGNQLSVQAGMSSKSNNDGQITQYSYDALNRVKTITNAENQKEIYKYKQTSGSTQYGQLESKIDPNGNITRYEYDGLNRLLSEKVETTDKRTQENIYKYALNGQKIYEENDNVYFNYEYDSLGRLIKQTDTRRKSSRTEKSYIVSTYTYDKANNRISFKTVMNGTTEINNVNYEYDNVSRLKRVHENGIKQAEYTYNKNSRVQNVEYKNATGMEYTYNKANWIDSVRNWSMRYPENTMVVYNYSYYADGNQEEVITTVRSNGEESTSYLANEDNHSKISILSAYSYDGTGRLSNEWSQIGIYKTYKYDRFGNRILETDVHGNSTVYEYSETNRLLKATSGTEISRYDYDLNGNQILKVTEKLHYETNQNMIMDFDMEGYEIYEYDGFNRLISSRKEEKKEKYTYRPDGLRNSVEREEEEIIHIWDGQNIVGELSSKRENINYLRGIDLIKSGDIYYHYNGQRDVTILTNDQSTMTKIYFYDAFGNDENISGDDKNPFRYKGEYYDKSTGTYYLRARYYNPVIGRFLTMDTHWNPSNSIYGDKSRKMGNRMIPSIYAIMQSSNLYVYALNNPLFWIDPSGYKIELSSDATKAQKSAYERAIAYLQTSETAAALIKILMDSSETFTIIFNISHNNIYYNVPKNIYWDPTSGLVLGDGKSIMSPAMMLAHEMGHAAQDLTGVMKFIASNNDKDKQVRAIEEDNLSRYETPIAKELGEYTRNNYLYTKDTRRMKNSTDWGYLKSNPVWYKPWTWFRKTFNNQNKWDY